MSRLPGASEARRRGRSGGPHLTGAAPPCHIEAIAPDREAGGPVTDDRSPTAGLHRRRGSPPRSPQRRRYWCPRGEFVLMSCGISVALVGPTTTKRHRLGALGSCADPGGRCRNPSGRVTPATASFHTHRPGPSRASSTPTQNVRRPLRVGGPCPCIVRPAPEWLIGWSEDRGRGAKNLAP